MILLGMFKKQPSDLTYNSVSIIFADLDTNLNAKKLAEELNYRLELASNIFAIQLKYL